MPQSIICLVMPSCTQCTCRSAAAWQKRERFIQQHKSGSIGMKIYAQNTLEHCVNYFISKNWKKILISPRDPFSCSLSIRNKYAELSCAHWHKLFFCLNFEIALYMHREVNDRKHWFRFSDSLEPTKKNKELVCLSRTRNLSKRCLPGNWTVSYFIFRLAREVPVQCWMTPKHIHNTLHMHTQLFHEHQDCLAFVYFSVSTSWLSLSVFGADEDIHWAGVDKKAVRIWRGSLAWIANWRTEEMIEIAKHFCIPHFFLQFWIVL